MSAAVQGHRNAKTYWSASREDCLAAVLRAYYEEGMVAQTVRHYYYKLLSYGLLRAQPQYPNSAHNAYKFVVDLCTDARRSRGGDLPYEAVVDPSRRSFTHYSQHSLGEMLRIKRSASFWADLWRGQPRRLAVYVEKDGMADMADSVVRGWRIPVYVCKGHSSISSLHRAAPPSGTAGAGRCSTAATLTPPVSTLTVSCAMSCAGMGAGQTSGGWRSPRNSPWRCRRKRRCH